jgi:hypothetical protein
MRYQLVKSLPDQANASRDLFLWPIQIVIVPITTKRVLKKEPKELIHLHDSIRNLLNQKEPIRTIAFLTKEASI